MNIDINPFEVALLRKLIRQERKTTMNNATQTKDPDRVTNLQTHAGLLDRLDDKLKAAQ